MAISTEQTIGQSDAAAQPSAPEDGIPKSEDTALPSPDPRAGSESKPVCVDIKALYKECPVFSTPSGQLVIRRWGGFYEPVIGGQFLPAGESRVPYEVEFTDKGKQFNPAHELQDITGDYEINFSDPDNFIRTNRYCASIADTTKNILNNPDIHTPLALRLYEKEWKKRFGENYKDKEKLQKKFAVVFYQSDGFGHAFQGYSIAAMLSHAGINVLVLPANALCSHGEDHRSKMNQRLYANYSQQKPLNLRDLIRFDASLGAQLGDEFWADILTVAGKHMDGDALNTNGMLTKMLDRFLVRLDTRMTSREIGDTLIPFLKFVKPSVIVHTHPLSMRAIEKTEYEEISIHAMPDPAYRNPKFALPQVALGNRTHLTAVADQRVKDMLVSHYQMPQDRIFPVGTIADRTKDIWMDKWEEDKRRVMISASGHFSIVQQKAMMQAVEDFGSELNQEKSLYELYLFLGHHGNSNDPTVKESVNEIEQKICACGLAENPRLIVVKTHDLAETAHVKNILLPYMHIEIAKPGENPATDPQVGTLFIALPAGSSHEIVNLKDAIDTHRCAVACAWGDSADYWTGHGFSFDENNPLFNRKWPDLVSYLNYLFGNNPAETNFARELADSGRRSAPRDAAFEIASLAIDMAINGPKRMEGSVEYSLIVRNKQLETQKNFRKESVENSLVYFQELMHFLTDRWQDVPESRERIDSLLLLASGEKDWDTLIQRIREKTAVLLVHAGSGSRYTDTWDEPKAREAREFIETQLHIQPDISRPRGLLPVPDYLGLNKEEKGSVPVAAYNLAAVRGLGDLHIIHRPEDKLKIMDDLIIPYAPEAIPHTQTYPEEVGKPLGHGDAILQILPNLQKKEFVLTLFAGDITSRATAERTLAMMYVLDQFGQQPGVIIPSAYYENPRYPIQVYSNGIPYNFGHPKMKGSPSSAVNGMGLSNIGLRVYSRNHLDCVLNDLEREYGSDFYAEVPGHKPGSQELALDDVDLRMTQNGDIGFQFPVGYREEVDHSLKALTDYEAYLKDLRTVLTRNGQSEILELEREI